MANRKIVISESDLARLNELTQPSGVRPYEVDPALRALADEIQRARIVADKALPKDVVALQSRVCIRDQKTGKTETYRIVMPEEASLDDGRVAITSPIGTALIGYRLGDQVTWEVPGGRRTWRIESVEHAAPGTTDDPVYEDPVEVDGRL